MTNVNEIILEKIKVSNRRISNFALRGAYQIPLIFLYDVMLAEECNKFLLYSIFIDETLHKNVPNRNVPNWTLADS